jgi:hypothetical protein
MSAPAALPGGSEWPTEPDPRRLACFAVDSKSDLSQDRRRSAKRRRLLESDAKEYPAGLIADDEGVRLGRTPRKPHRTDRSLCLYSKSVSKHLCQFARLRTFSWTAERLGQDPCALRRPMHRPGQKRQIPIAGGATKSVTQDLGPDLTRHCSCPGRMRGRIAACTEKLWNCRVRRFVATVVEAGALWQAR